MYDLVTFGEAMIRLTPPSFQRLEQAKSLDIHVGGAELNVAVGAARLGLRCAWVSRLPRGPLGALIRNGAREAGVDCSHILWSDEGRAGLYFLELGASPRPTRVVYDRTGSAFSKIRAGEVPWRDILEQARHLHITGITPALSESAADVTQEALNVARDLGRTVSFDINYRAKLWSPEKARQTLEPLLSYVDVLITNEGDPALVLDIKEESPETLARRLSEVYGIKIVLVTLKKGIGIWRSTWSALAFCEGRVLRDRIYEVEIVDRLGAGDSFAAGFLAEWLKSGDLSRSLAYGNAFAALQHTTPGDFNCAIPEEVEELMKGSSAKISR